MEAQEISNYQTRAGKKWVKKKVETWSDQAETNKPSLNDAVISPSAQRSTHRFDWLDGVDCPHQRRAFFPLLNPLTDNSENKQINTFPHFLQGDRTKGALFYHVKVIRKYLCLPNPHLFFLPWEAAEGLTVGSREACCWSLVVFASRPSSRCLIHCFFLKLQPPPLRFHWHNFPIHVEMSLTRRTATIPALITYWPLRKDRRRHMESFWGRSEVGGASHQYRDSFFFFLQSVFNNLTVIELCMHLRETLPIGDIRDWLYWIWNVDIVL